MMLAAVEAEVRNDDLAFELRDEKRGQDERVEVPSIARSRRASTMPRIDKFVGPHRTEQRTGERRSVSIF
jgi:hypothetical protein